MRKVIVAPEFPRYPRDWHFSPAIDAGGFVFFSGITGVHPDQSVAGDPSAQFRDVFQFVGTHLRAANLGFEHIVDMTTYHVDLQRIDYTWSARGSAHHRPTRLSTKHQSHSCAGAVNGPSVDAIGELIRVRHGAPRRKLLGELKNIRIQPHEGKPCAARVVS